MHVTRSASRASPRPCNRVRRVSARAHRRRSTGGPAGSQTPVLENINGSKKEGREEEGHEEDRQEGWRQEEDCPQGGKEAEVAGIAVAVCSMWNKEAGAMCAGPLFFLYVAAVAIRQPGVLRVAPAPWAARSIRTTRRWAWAPRVYRARSRSRRARHSPSAVDSAGAARSFWGGRPQCLQSYLVSVGNCPGMAQGRFPSMSSSHASWVNQLK